MIVFKDMVECKGAGGGFPDFVDSSGKKYYESLGLLDQGKYKVAFYASTGAIRQIESDSSKICPCDGLSVSVVEDVPSPENGSMACYRFDGESFDVDIKKRNEDTAKELMSAASKIISVLGDERDAGVISDSDLEKWKGWVSYRKSLREIDLSEREVDWPKAPAGEASN